MEKERTTFSIPEWRIPSFEHKIAQINRRAVKLGCPEITYTVAEPHIVEITETDGSKTKIKKCEVEIKGETPMLEGWSFVAKLQHIDGVVILTSVPGVEVPTEYREADPTNCDHCHTKRQRNDTFVLHHETEGYKQVGRNCLQDFLGGNDPKKVAAYCELLLQLAAAAEAEEGFGGGGWNYFGLLDVLARTSVAIREFGWTSRTKARDAIPPVMATADTVANSYDTRGVKEENRIDKKITEKDLDDAEKAVEWAQSINPDNDYLYNVKTVANMGDIQGKLLGIACSILPAHRRTVQRELEDARAKADSNHFGTIKKRELFNLTVTGVFTTEGYYGTTWIIRFIEGEGSQAVWFASKNPELEVGETYKIRGTVKKHDEYKGIKQTALTRCKVEG